MDVLVIYDEVGAATKAEALLKSVTDQADAAAQWSVKPWPLGLLKRPAFSREALQDAAGAHLLMLAFGGRVEIPPELWKWLEAWAARRLVPDAALALFDDSGSDRLSAAATTAVSEFANRHGLSLILDNAASREHKPTRLADRLHERGGTHPPAMPHVLEEVPADRYESWGINE